MSKYLDYEGLQYYTTKVKGAINVNTQNITCNWNMSKNRVIFTLNELKTRNTTGTWNDNVYEANKLKFTINKDNTITITSEGQAITSTTFLNIIISQDYNDGNQYVLSGCPSGGSAANSYSMILYNSNGSDRLAVDSGNTVTFTGNYNSTKLSLRFQTGVIYSEMIFRPMIALKSVYDITSEYEQGALSNVELTNNVATTTEIDNIWNGT